jgi:hypothetical protein
MPKVQSLKPIVPIDFVPGTHGHFLEFLLNKFFGYTPASINLFTPLGTSHNIKVDQRYQKNKIFDARHWYQDYREDIKQYQKIINIKFELDDLLLVSSVSLLRTAELNIDNDELEIDTVSKFDNASYRHLLDEIYQSYPFLDRTAPSIPRNVLREFYKFGFCHLEQNGYWLELEKMTYEHGPDVFVFNLKEFYNRDLLAQRLQELQHWHGQSLRLTENFSEMHDKFLEKMRFLDDKKTCDHIITQIIQEKPGQIPKLNLFQESYINAQLEKYFKKEMPFHDVNYFTSIQDVLNYIKYQAPNL